MRATPLEDHPKGRQFTLVTEAQRGRRAGVGGLLHQPAPRQERGPGGAKGSRRQPPPPSADWKLDGGLGRRYAAASGDRNPIHMHDLSAKLFGFPRAIAHGMWTKARALAALEGRLPDAYEVDVAFKKPILLPATVTFGSAEKSGRDHRVLGA